MAAWGVPYNLTTRETGHMMRTYKNGGAGHVTLAGEAIPKGGTITTEEDLAAKFPGKFTVVPTGAQAQSVSTPEDEKTAVQKAAEAGAKEIAAAETKAKAAGTPSDDGMTDVTKDFPSAEKAGVTVRRDKRGWWVFDGDEDPANEKALKKREVRAFIADLAE